MSQLSVTNSSSAAAAGDGDFGLPSPLHVGFFCPAGGVQSPLHAVKTAMSAYRQLLPCV